MVAAAFANVLSGQFGLGGTFGSIPSSVPKLLPTKPGSISATATDAGITVSWSHVFGAGGYWFWSRDMTAGQSFQRLPLPIPATVATVPGNGYVDVSWGAATGPYSDSITGYMVSWNEVPAATGYVVLSRNTATSTTFSRLPFAVNGNTYTVGWLFDGADKYEFCLVALNGSLESAPSNCLRSQP